ncbi:toll/interleukin-1 receptor domain-containing protein [Rufibacter aurantiacus]|uniref:toll/interleukin-1 receptor domain-containing protein n=1 Tax=Rufibacter aurantiacus TaxID=2817374 RepID=UPI001B3098BE|nr:toll/interleukin-1 receptor domain-containing protein [Rufibacter aurantiacus]
MSRIFISYSRKDLEWKERLENILRPLTRIDNRNFSIWTDSMIGSGENWFEVIQNALDDAHVAILLVTSDFLNSEFVNEREIPKLLKRRQNEGVVIIPVIVKQCLWENITWLSTIQCRPRSGRPLSSLPEDDADKELVELAKEIISLSKGVSNKPAQSHRFVTEIEGCRGKIVFGTIVADNLVIGNEHNEWFWIDYQKSNSTKLSTLSAYSSCLQNNSTEIFLGLYDKKLAYSKNENWEFVPMPSSVLSLTKRENDVITADSAGMISVFNNDNLSVLPISIKEPILQVLALQNRGFVILGVSGKLWHLSQDSTSLKQCNIPLDDPAWQLAPALQEGFVLLMHTNQLTLLDVLSNLVTAIIQPLPLNSNDVFRKIIPSFNLEYYGLLTDEGSFYLVPGNLRHPRLIDFSESGTEVSDINPHADGGFWLWTTDGRLYLIEPNGTFKKFNLQQVQYAFSSPGKASFIVWKNADKYYIGSPTK